MGKRMRDKFFVCWGMIIAALSLASFNWPVEENRRVTSSFGESRYDHFHNGVDMSSSDMKIYPAEEGKVIFLFTRSLFPLENYPGGGNFMILTHGGVYFSVYMHLEDGLSTASVYQKKDALGRMGNTGRSYASHLHFSVYEIKNGISINPLSVMPSSDDNKAPDILDLYLRIGEKYVLIKDGSHIRLTRNYPLLLKISDSLTGREQVGVYKLMVSHNEKLIFETVFDKIVISGKGLLIDKKEHDTLYDEKGFYKIENVSYSEGENIFRITASDYAGNTSEREFSFAVKLDMKDGNSK